MSSFKNLEEATEFFKEDKFATGNGIKIDELGEDTCECSMILTDNHRNAYGGVMGGVIFTLADFAFAVLSNQIHQLTVAQQVSINYLNAPKGDKLTAKAYLKKTGKTSTIINIDVIDETGREVAQFIGSGFKLNIK